MELSVKTIVIIILGIIVLVASLLFAFSSISKNENQTNVFWFFSSNITKRTSSEAGQGSGATSSCQAIGESCFGQNSDCCENTVVCRSNQFDGDLFCLKCGNGSVITGNGDFCEHNSDCCSGLICQNVGSQTAYCG